MTESFDIISPAEGAVLATIHYAKAREIDRAIEAAEAAVGSWRATSLDERLELVERFAMAFCADVDGLAELVTRQMGRPIADADETGGFLLAAREFQRFAPTALADRPMESDAEVTRFIRPAPLGVHLAICAWNFPVAMPAAIILPALIAGNPVIFKHAPQTALIGDRLNRAAREAGLPAGVFASLHMTHADAERLIGSGSIRSVHFIGSEAGGRAVHAAAGEALVSFALELGGKDPVYVRPDADLEAAASAIVAGAFDNAGQSCCSVERVYVHEAIHEPFLEALGAAAQSWNYGHPVDSGALIGPVATSASAARIARQIEEAVSRGARVMFGGRASGDISAKGSYVAPRILCDVDHGMRLMRDETFGPVVPIMKVASDEDAVRLMDDSVYGLTASVFTKDPDLARVIGDRLDVGLFLQNRCDHADPHLPWGGMRASGLGRTDGPTAFEGVTQAKSFHIRRSGDA